MQVLIVDDEKNIRKSLSIAVESIGHAVRAVAGGAEALEILRGEPQAVVLLDLRLAPEVSGLDVLSEIRRTSPRTAVVLMTAFATIENAVEAMRRGAVDYLPKPCTPEQLRQVLARIEKTRRLENRVAELESQLPTETSEPDLASTAPAMQRAVEVAMRAADSEATLLLLGESGTGKSVLARALHARSPRREGAFVTVSCPSLSRDLLESELFGHVKGAFTGAVMETWGKVAAADGGTLFLDEIGELPLEIQAKLLRLLQEREYERVGETKPRRANVRIISATNRDLEAAVREGRFREDLYYRLNVITVRLPALRERPGDIAALARRLWQGLSEASGRPARPLGEAAVQALERYAWPGNVREMRNVLERAAILAQGPQIEPEDLTETLWKVPEVRLGGAFTLREIEDEHIRRVVERSGSLEAAAEQLGINRATLYRRRQGGD